MPMLPFPPATKPDAAEHSLLRVLGGVLAFLSLLLTLLGIIWHQSVPDLILAIIVGMFALRVLLLWLGAKPQHQQPIPGWSSSIDPVRYAMQSPPYPQEQPAAPASPSSQAQSLYQLAPEQHMQQSVPLPPAAVTPPPPQLPRSVRPQRPPQAPTFPAQPAPPPQGVQPLPPSQPRSLWLPSPAPAHRTSQQGIWQYDDGEHLTQQQRGNDHGSA
jgi:hypothetical protein